MLTFYRLLTICAHPLLWGVLLWRGLRGKQEWHRLRESVGFASTTPPTHTKIIWLHAASVGEVVSVLPMVEDLLASTKAHILFTTTTRTAAGIVHKTFSAPPHIESRLTHQYAPFDSPLWVARFLDHWQPVLALRVESEIWANIIIACHRRAIAHVLINGRLSTQSHRHWQKLGATFAQLLSYMDLVLAQDTMAADRFTQLGVASQCFGNLKLDAPPLPAAPDSVAALRHTLGQRPYWLAASTHKGEESLIAQTHKIIESAQHNILTIIAPRHPERGDVLAAYFESQNLTTAQRSKGQTPNADTQIYLADTLGELGILFACVPIVAMGGTFLPYGGHNALEAVRHNCAIIHGDHTDNFAEIFVALHKAEATLRASTPATLAKCVLDLLNNPATCTTMIECATQYEQSVRGARQKTMAALAPIIETALAPLIEEALAPIAEEIGNA